MVNGGGTSVSPGLLAAAVLQRSREGGEDARERADEAQPMLVCCLTFAVRQYYGFYSVL